MSNIIKTAETDVKGIATFSDLELGTYFIQEDGQVDGYVLNDHVYKVEVTADGDLLTITCENTPTEMEFSKVGETGSKELEGAKLQVIDKETGSIIDEWISGKEPHYIHSVSYTHLDVYKRQVLKCQIGTSKMTGQEKVDSRGGRRTLPYVFTEQGISMLASVLHSEVAVNVSIGIMRAFVEMRHFMASNAMLFERISSVELRQLEYQKQTDEKF